MSSYRRHIAYESAANRAGESIGSELSQRVSQIAPEFLERIARSAADVPEAFRAWNASRAAHGERLREAIAAVIREGGALDAREIRDKLDSRALGCIPRLRMIQKHIRAVGGIDQCASKVEANRAR